jgi:hypothetical protein
MATSRILSSLQSYPEALPSSSDSSARVRPIEAASLIVATIVRDIAVERAMGETLRANLRALRACAAVADSPE